MSSVWGDTFKISLFGESHGAAVGVVIDGLPAGIVLDEEFIRFEMARRAPGDKGGMSGKAGLTTPRNEKDEYEILSGVYDGHTTGTPVSAIIRNTNTRSGDYNDFKNMPRPGHADFTGLLRYKGMNDMRGGGHFSARVTAGLVFAGAVAKQYLSHKGIYIGAHLKSVYNVEDIGFSEETLNEEYFSKLNKMRLPVINDNIESDIGDVILEAKNEGDSVGGVVEAAIIGLPAGYGDPIFDSIESKLAHMIYSVPGVKGLEFGAGFGITKLKGSQANDSFYFDAHSSGVKTKTNNNGGINGGITNGMPVIFKAALKPTPSIAKPQETLNLESNECTQLEIKGRHDPCIAVRAVPVIEAAAMLCILDILLSGGFQ